ncbi:hypothetical protein D1BOALGB6SA_738 [Olavius sp. associated proteobacterium Delta 1]|nr:hypothetical protein D1BOALGB6SA_738 [Olavius sp. associated proteobacterium Delta 1]
MLQFLTLGIIKGHCPSIKKVSGVVVQVSVFSIHNPDT